MNLINTNARSLRPKITSFVQCFINLALTFAIITETWLAHGSRLESDVESLLLGEGLAIHYLNRQPSVNGVTHGGVAIALKNDIAMGKKYQFPNPQEFEVLALSVNIYSASEKFVLIAAYIPPGYNVARGNACLQHISDIILDIKRKKTGQYIIVGGDFNQWNIGDALRDFPELEEVQTPPTRGDRHIDKIFTNFSEHIVDAGCVPPLETEGTAETRTYSDHVIQYCMSRIAKKNPIVWETYTTRPYNTKAADNFVNEMKEVDWNNIYQLNSANSMAIELQMTLDEMMDRHFPVKVVKKKESDLPWYNNVARRMTKKKLAIYKSEGKSDRWTAQSEKLEKYLSRGRQVFLQNQREKVTNPKTSAQFFKNVKAFKGADRPKDFNIRELRPGKSDQEIADEVAAFFNRISDEFQPLQPDQVPTTYTRDLPLLSPAQVQEMLLKSKKTTSMVPGDIFPKLVNRCSAMLAWPLSAIFNQIIRFHVWPVHWKREYVTVIPKKTAPGDFADLRNISCTLFFSKVFERYVLARMQEEISLKPNQFGGVRGCSTTHMIITILQEICENAEDYRSATVLCAIDFAKAFNRMSFQHCLEAIRKKNASSNIIALVATFLTDRTMTVRVGNSYSEPLPVSGGCPQGSILGVSLFNNTTEDLEENFVDFERRRMGHITHDPVPREPTVLQHADRQPARSSPIRDSSPPQSDLSPIGLRPTAGEEFVPKLSLIPKPQPVLTVPPVEHKVGTQVLTEKAVRIVKYVDDIISIDKVNYGPIPIVIQPGGSFKIKLCINTNNAFVSISTKAEEIGMIVNSAKTKLLAVSDALNYRPKAYILDSQGNRIESENVMNILGFRFSDRPNVNAHVDFVLSILRRKYWSLYHLRRVGFNEVELVRVYRTVLLPVPDYCCPAYHPMLTDLQDQLLERAQIGALRAVFGYGLSANDLRKEAGIETLRERRIRLTDNFANKCLTSPRFGEWFPETEGRRSARRGDKFKEFPAKNDRLKNSPLFYMRRRLNGKSGKEYGERNRIYRENFNL